MHIDELYFRTERLRKHAEELGELLDADVIIRCVTDSKGIRGIDDATKTLLRGSTIYFTITDRDSASGFPVGGYLASNRADSYYMNDSMCCNDLYRWGLDTALILERLAADTVESTDTIVERDTFVQCVDFFLTHSDCGGLTVKMINGEGKYLKESKRGFPTAAAAFYKMSGLIRLFPHSRRFAAYYMGHLPDDETNPIDILPGAYLMISRPALEKVGLLDESYFMYGEDIDF